MSKVYFVGGAPRTGKTLALLELIKQKPMLAASTDAIRGVAKGILSPEDNPKLFRTGRGDFGSEQHVADMKNQPDVVLKHEIASAEETWKSVLDFVGYYQSDGKDIAIEGVAVLPEQLSKAGLDFKAVFVVNLSDPTDNILEHAKNNPSDWVNKYDEATIRAYGKFNQIWNKYYADEAKKYGYPVVEVDTDNFEASIKAAVDLLLK
jgi:2-phosphoglycerate kinase